MTCERKRINVQFRIRQNDTALPAKRGLHPPGGVLEGCELECSLVVGNCLDQFGGVKVQINVNQVGEQPLGVPAVLLGVLHLQVAAFGAWKVLSVSSGCVGEFILPFVSCSRTASSIAANLSASSGLKKGSLIPANHIVSL